MRLGQRALAGEGRRDRHLHEVREVAHFLLRAGEERATTEDDERAARRAKPVDRGLERRRCWRGADARERREIGRRLERRGHRLAGEHVVGNFEDRRTGAPGGRDADARLEDLGQARRGLHAAVPLDAAFEEAPLLEGLRRRAEGAAVLPFARDVGDDREERHRRGVRLDQAGHEVARARTDRRVADADAAGRARVRIGGERGAALVAHEHVLDLTAPVRDAVVHRERLAAGTPEDVAHAVADEAVHELLPDVRRSRGRGYAGHRLGGLHHDVCHVVPASPGPAGPPNGSPRTGTAVPK